ncbi:MAG: SDR family oxidoreductase [Parvibaculum sp.]|uniref:SDR family oxidoreductase n=1 Tax=Parvibaculum sp. TaxID=2024848 RepID=UPI0025E0C275|nr:SDR family oxidoreductase [Parvibaculum sp.]MCE9650130.1 SDR family oxidoreductase [Parvibaculum sp.]
MNGVARRLFCFGLGFSARTLARSLPGFAIAGTCRSDEKAAALRGEGIEAFVFGDGRPLDAGALEGTTHLLLSVPPDGEGDPVFRALGGEIARLKLNWAGYLSTTGVYGDRAGDWVDEASPLLPTTERGRRRLLAEQQWQSLGLPLHIFRLAGIYGPGRNQLGGVADGTARRIVKPGQVFSRIHVDDVAAALAASMARPDPGAAYNLCDDEPAPPQDVVAYAAELLALPPPPEVAFEDAELSPMARSFYEESKRVSNRRMRDELGVALRYPTYREGLRALFEAKDL